MDDLVARREIVAERVAESPVDAQWLREYATDRAMVSMGHFEDAVRLLALLDDYDEVVAALAEIKKLSGEEDAYEPKGRGRRISLIWELANPHTRKDALGRRAPQ